MKNTKLIGVSFETLKEIDELKSHRESDSWNTKLNNIIDEHKRMLRVLRNHNLVYEVPIEQNTLNWNMK